MAGPPSLRQPQQIPPSQQLPPPQQHESPEHGLLGNDGKLGGSIAGDDGAGGVNEPPRGSEVVHLAMDVYATAFLLANNATPAMYSCNPASNSSMWLVWLYVLFIATTQSFVLLTMLFINPAVVDSHTTFVDCDNRQPAALFAASSPGELPRLTLEACRELDIVLEFPAGLSGPGAVFRSFEEPTYYFQAMFQGDLEHTLLQLVCCVWVVVQVYFADFQHVKALLQFRDFNRWLLPLKGEELLNNGWVMLIPTLQYILALGVAVVSCAVTCGTLEAFDVVLNSLAFTFISQVAQFFNEPLTAYYSREAIAGLDPEEYGTDPIHYLVTEYSEANASEDWNCSWYIREADPVAGLLTDFKFKHEPGSYPTPNVRTVRWLRILFFGAPLVATWSCWYFFTLRIHAG